MMSCSVSLDYIRRQLPANQNFMWAFTRSKFPQQGCKDYGLEALVPIITTKEEGGDGVSTEQGKFPNQIKIKQQRKRGSQPSFPQIRP